MMNKKGLFFRQPPITGRPPSFISRTLNYLFGALLVISGVSIIFDFAPVTAEFVVLICGVLTIFMAGGSGFIRFVGILITLVGAALVAPYIGMDWAFIEELSTTFLGIVVALQGLILIGLVNRRMNQMRIAMATRY